MRRYLFYASLVLTLSINAEAMASAPHPKLLEFEHDKLVTRNEVPLTIDRPKGFKPIGPVDHDSTFSNHPFAVTLAAYVGAGAFLMVHAERVLDHSGASDYSNLKIYELDGLTFHTKGQCASLSESDVKEEHDIAFLATNGFNPMPAVYLRQLFLTSDDHNAEVVVTYGERLSACPTVSDAAEFEAGFDKRMKASIHVAPSLGKKKPRGS